MFSKRSRREEVLGALGVYRAAFKTIEQTTPLTRNKVRVPIVTLGGRKGLGARVQEMSPWWPIPWTAAALRMPGTSFLRRVRTRSCGRFRPRQSGWPSDDPREPP